MRARKNGRARYSCVHLFPSPATQCCVMTLKTAGGQNLLIFRTSNLIGSCWPEVLLFQSWGSLLVLFGLGLSIVF